MTQGGPTDVNAAMGAPSASLSAPAWTITCRQREPRSFTGLPHEDVEDWLDHYERVSSFNRWDDSLKRRHVGFYLDLIAETWYHNNERDLPDWQRFTSELRRVFGASSMRTEAAKKKLDERVQRPGESYTSYIEDVIALCRRADTDMTEESRVRHVLKGISPLAFNALAAQNPTTINQIVTTCQRLDDLQSLRRQPIQWDSRASTDEADLRYLIRSIIREELAVQTSHGLSEPRREASIPGLRELIKQELASLVPPSEPRTDVHPVSDPALVAPLPFAPSAPVLTAPLPEPACSPLATVSAPVSRPPVPSHPGHVNPYPVPPAVPPQFAYGYPAWHLPRPICFYCGIRGHVSRFCRRRQQDERLAYSTIPQGSRQPSYQYYSQRFHDARRFPSPNDHPDQQRSPRVPRRSSPSASRRRSVSPLRPASQGANYHTEN